MSGRVLTPALAAPHGQEAPAKAGWLERLKAAARRHAPSVAATLLVLALWLAGLMSATRLGQLWPGFSLRYNTPVSAQAATAARRYAVENPKDAFWPTFWRQDTAKLESELFSASTPCLLYGGQGQRVWPAQFTSGGWPGATDEAGCAVSEALAHALWGSTDVLGKAVKMGDKTFTVRGVFEGGDPLLLAHVGDAGAKAGWQGAELDAPADTTRAKAEDFALKSGLGQPSSLLTNGPAGLATLVCWLPPAAGAVLWAGRRLARWGRAAPVRARVLAFGLLLALALLLPTLLGLLPAWLIPTRWSDFSFWTSLADTLKAGFDGLLSLAPSLRDVAAKKALLATVCASVAGLLPALWLGWRCAAPPQNPRAHHLPRQNGRPKALPPPK